MLDKATMQIIKVQLFFVPLIFAFALLVVAGSVSAQVGQDPTREAPLPKNIQEDIREGFSGMIEEDFSVSGKTCFDYYTFPSVQTNIGSKKDTYVPTETVFFEGELKNENPYPIIDGHVLVRIARKNQNYTSEGHHIVDEFIPLTGITIPKEGTENVSFAWSVPAGLPSGQYVASFFFSVGKKFNLAGLPFTNEVVGSSITFEVAGRTLTAFLLDRGGTAVNGQSYKHIGNWPKFPEGSEVVITQPISNLSNAPITARVEYKLFFWDSLHEDDELADKEETVTVPAKNSTILEYKIPKLEEPVAMLRIKVNTETEQALIYIRVLSDGSRIRLNFPGLSSFPLRAAETSMLFTCYHGTGGGFTQGGVSVTVSDSRGKIIGRTDYQGEISGEMHLLATPLVLNEDYDYAKISARVTDKNGRVVDRYEAEYNCKDIDPSTCKTPSSGEIDAGDGRGGIVVVLFIVALAVILIVLRMIIKQRK